MGNFITDEETSALGRRATVLKAAKDWDGAIACLKEMQERMWTSPLNWGIDAWCRLALVLQQAGRLEESEAEFQRLLDELPKLARRDVHWDDPNVSFGQPGKLSMFNDIVERYTPLIRERWDLSRKRELTKRAKKGR